MISQMVSHHYYVICDQFALNQYYFIMYVCSVKILCILFADSARVLCSICTPSLQFQYVFLADFVQILYRFRTEFSSYSHKRHIAILLSTVSLLGAAASPPHVTSLGTTAASHPHVTKLLAWDQPDDSHTRVDRYTGMKYDTG